MPIGAGAKQTNRFRVSDRFDHGGEIQETRRDDPFRILDGVDRSRSVGRC